MIASRRLLPIAIALMFVVASCGGSSDAEPDATDAPTSIPDTADGDADDFTEVSTADAPAEPVDTAAGETVPAEPPAEEVIAEPVATPATEEPTDGAVAADAFDVGLSEWAIDAPTEYGAGDVTFNATNNGSFPHEFVVIEGEGYEALPLTDAGAVIEDELPTGALIGRTGRLGGGSSEALTVTLAPGNYVLLCNLGGGGNSHAGQGQRLDITVS